MRVYKEIDLAFNVVRFILGVLSPCGSFKDPSWSSDQIHLLETPVGAIVVLQIYYCSN